MATDPHASRSVPDAPHKPAWLAVFSLALGVFSLVTAEFLPASLLTPMAETLGYSQALVGQAVTVTAAAALVSALVSAIVTRGLDRRFVLMGFSILLIASDVFVALATDLTFLLLARVLLGVALGGFWSMATAVAMRLVPGPMVPRALSIVFSGVSAATIVAAPVGAYLGHLFGWRDVFLLCAGLGSATLLFQAACLPSIVHVGTAGFGTLAQVARQRNFGFGMLCAVLVFGGHFALFTYIRPYLQDVAHLGIDGLSLLLLGFGLANFVGTLIAGALLEGRMRLTLTLMPMVIGMAALWLALGPVDRPGCALLVALWGMGFGGVPVGWSTWVARSVPHEAESAGGLLVAAVQLAIGCGAAGGGIIFDLAGAVGVFVAGGLLLVGTALLVRWGISEIGATPTSELAAS